MAKISTYPVDTNISGSDMLIGTDSNDGNATKNFPISGLISYLANTSFVPYTGAVSNVNLGSFGLQAFTLAASAGISLPFGPFNVGAPLNPGVAGQMLMSNGNAVAPFWFGQGLAGDLLISNGPGTPPSWTQNSVLLQNVMASYYSVLDQNDLANIVTDGPNLMIFEQNYFSHPSITIANNSLPLTPTFGQPTRITFQIAGKYNIQFTAQIFKSGGGAPQKASIWLRKNLNNINNSNRHTIPLNTNEYFLASWNFIVDVVQNDYVELCWLGAGLKLEYEVPTSGPLPPPHPATPSVTISIIRVAN